MGGISGGAGKAWEGKPVSQSQQMVDAVKAQGGNVKFTVYPDAGHDSWSTTYANPDLNR